MTVTIQRAKHRHLELVYPLFSQYRAFYRQEADPEAEREYLSARFQAGDAVIFIAREEAGGGAVGFALLYPAFDSVHLAPVWVLHDLFVAPGARRDGIGRGLMEAVHDFCRATGALRIDLATAVTNTVARPLYESLGYELDDEFLYYSLEL